MRALPSPDTIVAALRAEGCTVVEIPGWRTNNRNAVKAPGPWIGLLTHHTGGETSDPYGYAAGILFHGRSDLPGPLCNDSIGRNGVVYMVGYGRANHAGTCAQNTHDLLAADNMPLDSRLTPGPDAIDFNSLTWGVEVQGDTTVRPFSPEQYDCLVRHGAALCRLFGSSWTGGSIAAHGEATRRKPLDPTTDMPCLRRDVNRRLKGESDMTPDQDMLLRETYNRGVWNNTALNELQVWRGQIDPVIRETYNRSEWNNQALKQVTSDLAAIKTALNVRGVEAITEPETGAAGEECP